MPSLFVAAAAAVNFLSLFNIHHNSFLYICIRYIEFTFSLCAFFVSSFHLTYQWNFVNFVALLSPLAFGISSIQICYNDYNNQYMITFMQCTVHTIKMPATSNAAQIKSNIEIVT